VFVERFRRAGPGSLLRAGGQLHAVARAAPVQDWISSTGFDSPVEWRGCFVAYAVVKKGRTRSEACDYESEACC
jgi:hypothetical protein